MRRQCPPAETIPYHIRQAVVDQPYWDIAKQWVLADDMFQTQGSGSFTAHQDLIRGNTCIDRACTPSPPADSESLVDNPTYWPWGCDGRPERKNVAHQHLRSVRRIMARSPVRMLFQIYGSSAADTRRSGTCSTPRASRGSTIRRASARSLNPAARNRAAQCEKGHQSETAMRRCSMRSTSSLRCVAAPLPAVLPAAQAPSPGPQWGTNVSWPETNIFADITSSQLPAVSWVIPEDAYNDHPGQKMGGKSR